MYRLLLAVVLMTTLCVTVSAIRCNDGDATNYSPKNCPEFKTCLKKTYKAAGMCMMPNVACFIYKTSN